MQKKRVTVIGGGIAGMETAGRLVSMGFEVTLLEKGNLLGGHVADWHHLFPDRRPAHEIIEKLKSAIKDNVDIRFGSDVHKVKQTNGSYIIDLIDGEVITADAIVVATGFELFDASKKEEYGYGIYNNVITSAELEIKLHSGKTIKTSTGVVPKRIAFIHCVGSRDEKAGNTYCSKVCCITGIKQAIEVKQLIPEAEIYSFYMDLRMFDRYFEDTYYEAQSKYGIQFIRGRLSEACENMDYSLVLKAEDTLSGKPLKMTVDLMVLLVGMTSSRGTTDISNKLLIELDKDKFLKTFDNHLNLNVTTRKGIFVTGTSTGPKSVAETLADARSAALQAACYLNQNCN
jgi:heterodisulfide reductase subunit A2